MFIRRYWSQMIAATAAAVLFSPSFTLAQQPAGAPAAPQGGAAQPPGPTNTPQGLTPNNTQPAQPGAASTPQPGANPNGPQIPQTQPGFNPNAAQQQQQQQQNPGASTPSPRPQLLGQNSLPGIPTVTLPSQASPNSGAPGQGQFQGIPNPFNPAAGNFPNSQGGLPSFLVAVLGLITNQGFPGNAGQNPFNVGANLNPNNFNGASGGIVPASFTGGQSNGVSGSPGGQPNGTAGGMIQGNAIAPTRPNVPAPPTSGPAFIDIRVPQDAEVYVQGERLSQSGPTLRFQSPTLNAGTAHTYVIKAVWTQNGQKVGTTERVIVQPGDHRSVLFLSGTPLQSDR